MGRKMKRLRIQWEKERAEAAAAAATPQEVVEETPVAETPVVKPAKKKTPLRSRLSGRGSRTKKIKE